MKVLFVCTGDTCRSVFAEYLGRRFCEDTFRFESAGIRPQRAEDAENAIHILRNSFGIDASGHRPRNVRDVDVGGFDLVVAIEKNAATVVRELGVPESKMRVWSIRDPWGGDLTEYERNSSGHPQTTSRTETRSGRQSLEISARLAEPRGYCLTAQRDGAMIFVLGYRIFSDVVGEQQTSDLLHALETSNLTRSRAGARHLMPHPGVYAVANDSRLLAIASECLGASAVPYRATLFDKSAARNWLVTWHQDTALPLEERREAPGWGPWSVKSGITYAHAPASALSRIVALRLHFDDSGSDNGPLRVIPGSHDLGVLSDSDIDAIVETSLPVDCLVAAGGIVAMRPLILHASSKAESERPRRVLHLEYAESLDLDDGLRIAIA